MEAIIAIIVQLVAGGAGGNIVGQLSKNMSLGATGNSIVGAVGGLILTWIAGQVPGLSGIVNGMATSGASAGGLDMGALLGQGVTGLIGGGGLTAIAAMIKNATAKS
jgi:hypothetical protein